MSKIRSKNTSIEVVLRKFLFSKGFRYRIHDKKLPGHPDIVLKKYRTVIFVHGCFWHHHEKCKYAYIPKSHTEYWVSKFRTNTQRDMEVYNQLVNLGWRVVIIWECELRNKHRVERLEELVEEIKWAP